MKCDVPANGFFYCDFVLPWNLWIHQNVGVQGHYFYIDIYIPVSLIRATFVFAQNFPYRYHIHYDINRVLVNTRSHIRTSIFIIFAMYIKYIFITIYNYVCCLKSKLMYISYVKRDRCWNIESTVTIYSVQCLKECKFKSISHKNCWRINCYVQTSPFSRCEVKTRREVKRKILWRDAPLLINTIHIGRSFFNLVKKHRHNVKIKRILTDCSRDANFYAR